MTNAGVAHADSSVFGIYLRWYNKGEPFRSPSVLAISGGTYGAISSCVSLRGTSPA